MTFSSRARHRYHHRIYRGKTELYNSIMIIVQRAGMGMEHRQCRICRGTGTHVVRPFPCKGPADCHPPPPPHFPLFSTPAALSLPLAINFTAPRTLVIEELPPANLDFVQAHGIRLVQIGVEGNKVSGRPRQIRGHGHGYEILAAWLAVHHLYHGHHQAFEGASSGRTRVKMCQLTSYSTSPCTRLPV